MKNLVMGVAKGYGWNDIEPFVVSFKKNCPDADLVLFVDDLSDFTENKLKRGGVQLQQIPDNLKSVSIIYSRFTMYKNFLDEHTEYENIFLTDVRDVIFQGDLFSSYADNKNFLMYAAEADLIKNDPGNYNQSWIKNLFGEIEYQKIADKPIVCCGTIYASRTEMNILIDNLIKFFRYSTDWGEDQATINYLIHNGILPIENIVESNVMDGEIFTVGLVKNPKISNGIILREDGKIPAVVHQYDRNLTMRKTSDITNREEIFRSDENFTDILSVFDQMFCLVQRQFYREATKFFVSNILYADNLKIHVGKIFKIYQNILQQYNPDAEILILSIQRALVNSLSTGVNIKQMENIYRLFIVSERKIHVVNASFKDFVKNMLIVFIDTFYRNNQPQNAKECIRRLSEWKD